MTTRFDRIMRNALQSVHRGRGYYIVCVGEERSDDFSMSVFGDGTMEQLYHAMSYLIIDFADQVEKNCQDGEMCECRNIVKKLRETSEWMENPKNDRSYN